VTVRGVARLVFGIVRDWARGVAICTAGAVEQALADMHTLTHLADNIRDACTNDLDDRLAVYEAHAWPHEDTTRRDGVARR
jgi:hypothetical protein